ncbi:hypothetical protein [Nannocystis punicea]|uniref:Uncharacterized protein n=1 Tax=Nannocystis punicea TaxID=2995304 RepID=A0ABY7H9F8_9BACT|nr:hypothetical protein [Nannocystis poenicansa]WAS95906.1 hypothetical protein O0S08_07055 [Nannocystis poenicansa]
MVQGLSPATIASSRARSAGEREGLDDLRHVEVERLDRLREPQSRRPRARDLVRDGEESQVALDPQALAREVTDAIRVGVLGVRADAVQPGRVTGGVGEDVAAVDDEEPGRARLAGESVERERVRPAREVLDQGHVGRRRGAAGAGLRCSAGGDGRTRMADLFVGRVRADGREEILSGGAAQRGVEHDHEVVEHREGGAHVLDRELDGDDLRRRA